ncbi:hypothetical protein RA977_004320, partial [Cronobacter sakazakii]|nr:hypothetical protein [Cronobacter sakazakii]
TGTLADWVMAGAAVYAAFRANGWFSQRLHSKGLDKAEEILLSIDNCVTELETVLFKLDEIKYYLDAIHSNHIKADYEVLKTYDQTSKYLADKFNHINNIRHNTKLLYRWNIKTKKAEIFNNVYKYFISFYLTSSQSISLAHNSVYNICYMTREEFENSYVEYHQLYEKTQVELVKVRKAYDVLTSHEFNDMFLLKKPH